MLTAGPTTIFHLRCLLHLAAWAQIGVLTRIYANKLFGSGCHTGHASVLCVTSRTGALFYDFPANVIGSAIMGFLTPTDALVKVYTHGSLEPGSPMPFLPRLAKLQADTAFHIGLRTGFCGSLTTFSSWHLQMVKMLCIPGQHSWLAAILACYIGVTTSLGALAAGQHASLWIHTRLTSRHPTPSITSQPRPPSPQLPHPLTATSEPLYTTHPHPTPASPGKPSPPHAALELITAAEPTRRTTVSDPLSAALLFALTAVSLYITVRYTHSDTPLFQTFLSVLLGPPGCILRWYLGLLNGRLPRSWAWFPLGTFLANVLACCISFSIAAALHRREGSLSDSSEAALNAVMLGVCGALSTVSTWVVEVQQLLAQFPQRPHAYTYMAASVLGCMSLGVVIFGSSVWA